MECHIKAITLFMQKLSGNSKIGNKNYEINHDPQSKKITNIWLPHENCKADNQEVVRINKDISQISRVNQFLLNSLLTFAPIKCAVGVHSTQTWGEGSSLLYTWELTLSPVEVFVYQVNSVCFQMWRSQVHVILWKLTKFTKCYIMNVKKDSLNGNPRKLKNFFYIGI